MTTVRLQGMVHLGDIASWSKNGGQCCFELSSHFRFDPVAEGLASIKVMELRNKVRYSVRLNFSWEPSDGVEKLGSLRSLFGLCLAYDAEQVLGDNGNDIKNNVLGALWVELQENKGELGDNERRYAVCREPDIPIPACLGKTSPGKFPLRESIGKFLSTSAEKIGVTLRQSPTEDQITTFLYEAAHNSHEHGRIAATTNGLIGFRGIVASRFLQSDLEKSDGFPMLYSALRAFEQRLSRLGGKSVILLAYTVTDFGRGIQYTLPAKTDAETLEERFIRAFRSGESRKAPGTATSVGEGLDKVLAACRSLGAFVFAHSSGLLAYADFSASGDESMDTVLLKSVQTSASAIGTAITVIWPKQPNPDQLPLF